MRDASLKCWGDALGTQGGELPAPFAGRWAFVRVAAGSGHTCGIVRASENERARVLCFGANGAGQLGEPPSALEKHPKILEIDARDIACGGETTCARDAAGATLCWGKLGTLGQTPAPVAGLGGSALEIALGRGHACARKDDGTVWCWGKNDHGQLGDGTTIDRASPVMVPGLSDVTRVAAGGSHTCARVKEELVRCWGANDHGQLGDGTTVERHAPVTTHKVSGAVQLALGGATSCARMQDASLTCWGDNSEHQLADASTKDALEPALVFGVFDVVEVAVGDGNVCARFRDALVKCWGANASGQLGDGTKTARSVPVFAKL
jgi:alpha-tubulin suppressor-like RCC1 family protein